MTSISARRFNISSRMVLPTTSMTPSPKSAPVSQTTRRKSSSIAFRRCTHSVSSCTMSTSASAAMLVFSASVPSGVLAAERRRDDERVRQRIVGERIERLAESGRVAKIRERLVGGYDAYRRHIRAGTQLLRQSLGPLILGLLVEVHRQIERLVPIGGGGAGVLQEHVQKQRQRERHRDHGHGHQGCQRILHDAAQGPDQDLGVACEPGFDGAGHFTRPRPRPRPRRRRLAGRSRPFRSRPVRRRARCAAPRIGRSSARRASRSRPSRRPR